jgi:3-oxoacyl-(acyl-carrier-protein) synthase
MSVYIAGMGWVTPLGSGVREVWEQICAAKEPVLEEIAGPSGSKPYSCFRVPASALARLPAHARLRRASAISRFAAAAAIESLGQARDAGKFDTSRLAVVFAISNGGVIYTKRFYSDIVSAGAGAASPLLFPETVFNAPASHVAALFGVTGPTYTLVGDGAVGLSAFNMGVELLRNDTLDYCLVVGAEEADWLLCDAYKKWRLLRKSPPIELFCEPPQGTILSEGAGAVLLARHGMVQVKASHPGAFYPKRRLLQGRVESVLREIDADSPRIVVTSANGTFADAPVAAAISRVMPSAQIYSAVPSLGEGVGADGLWQIIIAAQILLTNSTPVLPDRVAGGRPTGTLPQPVSADGDVIVLTCGMNQQIGAACLTTTADGR